MSRGSERQHRQAPRWLAGARELLRARCADGIRISAVAAAAGVHPVHLIRTFREFFCATPGEYVRRCRLERAARLLADSDVSLVDVALESGYADQSHFSKAFKRQFAIAPSQYRRDVNSVQEATTPL
jgi:AraC family transcriptional regulator